MKKIIKIIKIHGFNLLENYLTLNYLTYIFLKLVLLRQKNSRISCKILNIQHSKKTNNN